MSKNNQPKLRVGIALAALLLLISTAANAALVEAPVYGTWTGWLAWNPGQNGGAVVTLSTGGGPNMEIRGQITYEDSTGEVTAASLRGTDQTSVWEAKFNSITLTGFSWTSDGTSLLMDGDQDAVCNGEVRADCGQSFGNGGGFIASGQVSDWNGIPEGGLMGNIQGEDVFLAAQPGFQGVVLDGEVDLTTWGNIANPFGLLLASQGLYELRVVPIPGAVWFFGSALGLLGWFRRRHHA